LIGAFLFGIKKEMERKKFLVKIRAFGHATDFMIEAADSIEAVEQAVLDKIGEKSIVWEANSFFEKRKCYLTYEEVKDANRQDGVIR